MIDRGEVIRKAILNGARWSGLSRLYRVLFPSAGAILMLHRVTAAETSPLGFNRHLSVTPQFLDTMLSAMKREGYAFVSLDELAERLERGGDSRNLATVTADDGYRDNMSEALPVLEAHDAPLTIYIAPGQIDRRICLWWTVLEEIIAGRDTFQLPSADGPVRIDCVGAAAKARAYCNVEYHLTSLNPELDQDRLVRELAALTGVDADRPGRDLLMDWDEIRAAARHRLVTFGAHAANHYNLRRLTTVQAAREIAEGAERLEQELGTRPAHMAYPYGYEAAVGEREMRLAREAGFRTATTTRHGLLTPEHRDYLHALPRLSVNGRYQSVAHMRTMLSGITTPIANRGKRLVTV